MTECSENVNMTCVSQESKTSQKYLTSSQKNELIQLVGDNYNVLFDRKMSNVVKRNHWMVFSLKLNAMGPMKTVDGWKRCFTTLKAATKAKYLAGLPLSDIERKIWRMCQMDKLDVSREQSKKARKPIKKVVRQLKEGMSSNSIAAPIESQVDLGNSSTQIDNAEEMGTYATESQKRRLVRVVRDNYSALFGRVSTHLGAETLKEKIWTLLSCQLNCLGPKKEVKGWQNCFNYLKSKTKEKLTSIRQYKMRQDVSPVNIEISEIESEIIEMCNIDTLDGHSKVLEMGLRAPSVGVRRVRSSTSSVQLSTVASSIVSPTVRTNALNEFDGHVYEWDDSSEVLTYDNVMNTTPSSMTPIPRSEEENGRDTPLKTPHISSVRTLRYMDESIQELRMSNQAPIYDIDSEPQLLSLETLMVDAARNEMVFESQRKDQTAREEVSFQFHSSVKADVLACTATPLFIA